MALTVAERKALLEQGEQKEIAAAEKVSETYVSLALSDGILPRTEKGRRTLRRVRVAIARRMGRRVDDVFGPITGGPRDDGMATTLAKAANA
jgi:hypothetical protein